MTAEARWATPRTLERKTLGHAVGRVSRLLGAPFMGWQQDWANVAYELNDEGQFAYDTVVTTVMRQQGKTTGVRAINVTRPLLAVNQAAIYTAQTGKDARKKWKTDWIPAIQRSPLGSQVRVNLAPGMETMSFLPTGSRLDIVATTEQAGHGDVIDQGTIDEAFAFEDARVEQAMRPAMMTRWNLGKDYSGRFQGDPRFAGPMMGAQLYIPSTVGTLGRAKGVYLRDYCERGRKAVESGLREGLCYIEYSAPEGADPADPATWRACMPALGFTVDERVVAAAQKSMRPNEFARAFLNQWVIDGEDPIVAVDHWQGLADPSAARPPWVVLGVDVGPKDSSAAIVAAGPAVLSLSEGETVEGIQTTVLDHGRGAEWLLEALAGHCERYDRPYLLVDGKACAHLIPELEAVSGFRVIQLGPSDVPPACQFWLRMATERRLRHRGEPELAAALVGAGQRSLGDGWAFSRTKSGADITPLVAQMLAASYWMGAYGEDDT